MKKENHSSESVPEQPEPPIAPTSSKWDVSLIISLFAVFISCATMAISLVETKIMNEQQKIMREQQDLLAEQKNASVWPFMQPSPSLNYTKDGKVIYTYQLINKGIGPAILGDVDYMFDGVNMESYNFFSAFRKKFPKVEITGNSNNQIDNFVFSSGEEQIVISLTTKEIDNSSDIMSSLFDSFHCEFNYSSVYGECWRFNGKESIKIEDCDSSDKK